MIFIPESSEVLSEAMDVLHRGGTVGHATETCYGFACDLTNREAVERLFQIKKRGTESPVSGLFQSIDHAGMFVEWNDKALELANKYLPGPLTIILPIRKEHRLTLFPTPLTSNATLGVRISSHGFTQKLIDAYGSPLSTTSGNIHGLLSPYSAEDIRKQFENEELQPDLIVDSGQVPQNDSSTVVDVCAGEIRVIRQGDLRVS